MTRCATCRTTFREPEDEQGTHPCPRCGYSPDDEARCAGCGRFVVREGLMVRIPTRFQLRGAGRELRIEATDWTSRFVHDLDECARMVIEEHLGEVAEAIECDLMEWMEVGEAMEEAGLL